MSTAVKFESRDARTIPFQEASLDIWDKKYRLSAKDGTPIDADHGRHLQACRPGARRRRAARRARALVRAVPVGAASRRHSRRPGHLERRRAGAQARHVDDQLHGLGHHPRLDGRHPRQGARGGPHAEGGLRDRLRVLDAASARRVRVGRRRLHLRARCRSWISTTRCASPCRPPAVAAARRWARSTSATPTRSSSSAPSARTAGCGSSTCRCWSPTSSWHAVREDRDWQLAFPIAPSRGRRRGRRRTDRGSSGATGPTTSNYVAQRRRARGLQDLQDHAGATRMWDVIMSSTYDFAEPGFILIDRVNEMNNNWWCETIRATNPCVTADTRLATQFGHGAYRRSARRSVPTRSHRGSSCTRRSRYARSETRACGAGVHDGIARTGVSRVERGRL